MAQSPVGKISTTHDIEFDEDRVVKTFRTWERGEHLREWRGLNLLHQFAPGLGPEPISAELNAQPPRIVMSRVPGEPLGTRQATPEQVDALVIAIERMHRSVPDSALAKADPQDTPADVAKLLKKLLTARARPTDAAPPSVRRAFNAAAEFIASDWAPKQPRSASPHQSSADATETWPTTCGTAKPSTSSTSRAPAATTAHSTSQTSSNTSPYAADPKSSPTTSSNA